MILYYVWCSARLRRLLPASINSTYSTHYECVLHDHIMNCHLVRVPLRSTFPLSYIYSIVLHQLEQIRRTVFITMMYKAKPNHIKPANFKTPLSAYGLWTMNLTTHSTSQTPTSPADLTSPHQLVRLGGAAADWDSGRPGSSVSRHRRRGGVASAINHASPSSRRRLWATVYRDAPV